jgi:lysophospholipase L1-like esterase
MTRGSGAKRAGLLVVSVGVALALAGPLLEVGERLGVLASLAPPPHFRRVLDAAGNAKRDAGARELFAIDPVAAAEHPGPPASDRFALTKEKAAGTFRVLSIGESTTFGAGFGGRASYSRFLEMRLRRRLARDSIEVVNCGKNGYDSHDWPTLADELDGFAPDLLVLYVGHNELKKPNLLGVVDPAKARLRDSKFLRRLLGEPTDDLPVPPSLQVGPSLTAEQRAFALERFERGLRALLDFARERRVPVVLCIPASNVLDQPPRLSIVQPGADASVRLAEAGAAAESFTFGELPNVADPGARATAERALAEVERAIGKDPEPAILHFRRGRLLVALGRVDEARAAFARSLERDGLPERASPDIVERTRALAREYGVLVADVEKRFEREAARGVAGDDLFFDYCHPNLYGHWVVADEILAVVEPSGVVAPASGFDPARETGGTPRERFDACCAELGLTASDFARSMLAQSEAQLNALGTRSDPDPASWKLPGEYLEWASRLDPEIVKDAEFRVVRAVARAGLGDRDGARADLAAADAADAAKVAALAAKVAALPGLVAALRAAGIEVDATGFHR